MGIQEKIGAGVLSLGLVIGLSGFAGATTGTIDTTGARSDNHITSDVSHEVNVENDNDLNVHNDNDQYAASGEAEVRNNTTGDDAVTGAAWNDNALDAEVVLNNSASVGSLGEWVGTGSDDHEATIQNTGNRSENTVDFTSESTVDISNDNNLNVTNTNNQTAVSGDATVRGNTTGGSAMTGDATNTNSTTIRFDVTN